MHAEFDVDAFLADHPLAITLAGLEELRLHVAGRVALFAKNPSDGLRAALTLQDGQRQQNARQGGGAVAVIPIRGTISQHASGDLSSLLFGGATCEEVSTMLREALADATIGKIVLDIDSPGGSTYGVQELAGEIFRARSQKPIVAFANSKAASAAWWLASMCSKVYATAGAIVGSIGVYTIHQDISQALEKEGVVTTMISAGKFKTEGNPFEPLPDEAKAYVQSLIDETYSAFIHDVARGRGVSDATVRNGYGQGRILSAKMAQTAGMIDGIYTLEQVIARPEQIGKAAPDPAAPAASADLGEDPEEDADDEEGKGPDGDEEASARRGRMRARLFKAKAAAGAAN